MSVSTAGGAVFEAIASGSDARPGLLRYSLLATQRAGMVCYIGQVARDSERIRQKVVSIVILFISMSFRFRQVQRKHLVSSTRSSSG